MELFFVSFIITIATFLNSLSYIAGALKTAPGMVFLGTVHYPLDYFYYLSQIIQGRSDWFLSYHLHSGEFTQKVLVGWPYVFFGRIFSFLRVSPILTYQIMVVLFSILFLSSAYLLIRNIFPSSVKKRLLAFILFGLSNGFPRIVSEPGKWTFSFYDSWNNYGFPFVRLGNVPHHLLIHTLIMFTLLLTVSMLSKKNYSAVTLLLFLSLGLIMGSLQPAQWVLLTLTISICAILSLFTPGVVLHNSRTWLGRLTSRLRHTLGVILLRLLFTAIFFLSGILPVFYLKQLFGQLPFSQAIAWESTQHLHLSAVKFILIHGPLAILAIIGLPLFLKQLAPSKAELPYGGRTRLVMTIYTILSLGIFFSPLPQTFGVLNVRFLSVVYVLFFACVSTQLITALRIVKKIDTLVQSVSLVVILLLALIPSFLQMKTRLTFDPHNAYYYLPKEALSAYNQAQKISTPNDIFLILWPFEVSFPGLTGRRVFLSNFISTTNYNQRAVLADQFFTAKMSDEEAKRFLRENNIKYVLVYPWTFSHPLSFLDTVYQNNFLTIYKTRI